MVFSIDVISRTDSVPAPMIQAKPVLEESSDLLSFRVQVDVVETGPCWQPWNRGHLEQIRQSVPGGYMYRPTVGGVMR